jgi:hypothetical protein
MVGTRYGRWSPYFENLKVYDRPVQPSFWSLRGTTLTNQLQKGSTGMGIQIGHDEPISFAGRDRPQRRALFVAKMTGIS